MSGKCAFLLTLSLLFAVSFSQKLDCSKLSFDDDYDDTPTATPPTGILASPLPGTVGILPYKWGRGSEKGLSAYYKNFPGRYLKENVRRQTNFQCVRKKL